MCKDSNDTVARQSVSFNPGPGHPRRAVDEEVEELEAAVLDREVLVEAQRPHGEGIVATPALQRP